jgi:hypothetical protein
MAKENSLSVIVRRGTLVVDKKSYSINAEVSLPESEANRLIALGVVSAVAAKGGASAAPADPTAAASAPGAPAAILGSEGVKLTSSDGPSVTQTQA